MNRLLDEGKNAGFPGCIGSIDCMHWEWKNCPSSWKGVFQGKSGRPTVMLEAIADHSCCFWHFHFGSPGSLNDINVLDRFPSFYNAVNGEALQIDYVEKRKPLLLCILACRWYLFDVRMFRQDVPATKNTHAENVCKRPRG